MSYPDHPKQPHILIVGGANTGRSPIAAAFLGRILQGRELAWTIETAGVIGYDDDPPEPEACYAMDDFDLDISTHRARTITLEMVEQATVLLAIDTSVFHALRTQYPSLMDRITTMGRLAGQPRDIPDPYRMQVSAWVSYAREIETMLQNGVDALIQMVEHHQAAPAPAGSPPALPSSTTDQEHQGRPDAPPPSPEAQTRTAAVDRCLRILTVMHDMPTLIAWDNARTQMETELETMSTTLLHPTDFAQPYTNMLRALLAMITESPTSTQLTRLRSAVEPLRTPIDQAAITALSTLLAHWNRP